MLNVLIYESDLMLLYKLKSIFTTISFINEVEISNDESSCLNLVSAMRHDLFVLKIDNDNFKDKLLKLFPDIISHPFLATNPRCDLSSFKKLAQLEITRDVKIISILSALSEIVQEDILKYKTPIIEGYVPVRNSIFRKLKTVPCGLYLQLGLDKFVKIINSGEEAHSFLLDRYESRNIYELYITKIDFHIHSELLFGNTLPERKNYDSKIDYFSNSQQVIKDLVLEIGINENTIKLAEDLSEAAVLEYKDSNLSLLLRKFKYSKDRYIYDHGVLTSIFAVAMCGKFAWNNRQIMQKIVFASIFHDFAFSDPKLAIYEINPQENSNLTKQQIAEILNHPEKMTELLSTNKLIPGEVLSIISKHHEAHGERSYPNGLTSVNLSILECVFLVAHEFTTELYKIEFRQDKISKAVENVLVYSDTGNLKQVRNVFQAIVADKFKLN